MNPQTIQNLSQVTLLQTDHLSESSEGFLSLEERLKNAVSGQSANETLEKAHILQTIESPINTSNPVTMLEMQRRIGEYDVNMRLISSLTHKATDAVSTLLKS